jgi:hypothetical protein
MIVEKICFLFLYDITKSQPRPLLAAEGFECKINVQD